MNKDNKLILEENITGFKYKKNLSNLNVSFNRIAFIFFAFLIVFILYSSKIIFLSNLEINLKKNLSSKSEFRSNIVDRNGKIIAKSVITKNIGINPPDIIDKSKLILNLKIIFPDKDYIKISEKINKGKFFYLEKNVSRKNYKKLFLLGDKSIKEEPKISRIYPNGALFSHILGQIDDNNNGISGLEKSFDYELKTTRNDLKLSLDSDIQYLIREELIASSEIFKNIGAASILLDVNTGEIISMVSVPDFDLNKRENIIDKNLINRATKGVYEFGSVFKTFTFAAGLNEEIIDVDTPFENLKKNISCAGNNIGEYDNKIPTDLTAEEILIRSGNIGSVRIGQKLGIDKYSSFLNIIGITSQINFDIEETGNPIPFKWGKCKLATSSFGHGITTTLLQLSKAYAVISNGGYLIEPTLIRNKKLNKENYKRVLNKKVSDKVNKVLRKIVSTKEGTAGFANVKGYEVAGKTGTAQKSENGKYTNKKVNTFVSVFPYSKPKFTLLVLLDEPEANQEYIYTFRDGTNFKYKGNNRNTAGWTSVEIAGKIIEKIGPILATKY